MWSAIKSCTSLHSPPPLLYIHDKMYLCEGLIGKGQALLSNLRMKSNNPDNVHRPRECSLSVKMPAILDV